MSVIAFLMTIIYGIIIATKILIVILELALEVIGGAVVVIISSLVAVIRAFRRR